MVILVDLELELVGLCGEVMIFSEPQNYPGHKDPKWRFAVGVHLKHVH